MQLSLFRHLWGVNESWSACFPRFNEKGYSGIECTPPEKREHKRFLAELARQKFDFIADISTTGSTVTEHVLSFRHKLRAAAELSPRLVNCHSGSDAWTEAEAESSMRKPWELNGSAVFRLPTRLTAVGYFTTPG